MDFAAHFGWAGWECHECRVREVIPLSKIVEEMRMRMRSAMGDLEMFGVRG